LCRIVAFDEFNLRRFELRAHGRVHAGVAASDAVAGGARQLGKTAHEGAADAEDMNMHLADPS
jgi:hypothetical protein